MEIEIMKTSRLYCNWSRLNNYKSCFFQFSKNIKKSQVFSRRQATTIKQIRLKKKRDSGLHFGHFGMLQIITTTTTSKYRILYKITINTDTICLFDWLRESGIFMDQGNDSIFTYSVEIAKKILFELQKS